MDSSKSKLIFGPAGIALVVAIFGSSSLLIADHDPWHRAYVQSAPIVRYTTTAAAAQAVGATVTPTAPGLKLKPVVRQPSSAQSAITEPSKSRDLHRNTRGATTYLYRDIPLKAA
jgi:hypothetical protein